MLPFATRSFALATLLAATSCSTPDGTQSGHAVAFHGSQTALPGFMYDTGFLPAMSPIQVRVQLNAAGNETVDAQATHVPGAMSLAGTGGSGRFVLDGHIVFHVLLNIAISAPLGQGIMYSGPLMNAPNIDLHVTGSTGFDPFLVGGMATLTAPVPDTIVATIPLAGAVPVPGISGNLILHVSGTLTSVFTGTCAAATADGLGVYTGQTVTSGMLIVRPEVMLAAGPITRNLAPVDVPVMVPPITAAMTLTASMATMPVVADGGVGSIAEVGTCSGDGGVMIDGSVAMDGATSMDAAIDGTDANTAPGRLFGPCTTDTDCAGLGAGATCKTSYPTPICTIPCTTDAVCSGGRCDTQNCRPACTSGGGECDHFGGACYLGACYAACFPTGTTAPPGFPVCPATAPCNAQTTGCGSMDMGIGNVGDPCTMGSDCRSGSCYPEIDSAMPTGFLGGYCLGFGRVPAVAEFANGVLPRSDCPPGSVVLPDSGSATGDLAYCFRTCLHASDCRVGYSCQAMLAGSTPTMICIPVDCSMAGMACPTGTTCQTVMGGGICANP